MTVDRRQVLGTLGVGAAEALLFAFGCRTPAPISARRAPQVSSEVRGWLHDAVARLAAVHPAVHALAVSRRRTAAARDALGAGIARLHAEGVVLSVRDSGGAWREHATSDLTRRGVDAAAHALGAPRSARSIDFGLAPASPDEPAPLDERDLHERLEHLLSIAPAAAPRIVYAAGAIDVDDAIVWSVSPGRDLEQRRVRIRQTALRAAWNGSRPVVRHAERAWAGSLDDQPLTPADLAAASAAALEVLTPGRLDDGERAVVLDPSVVAVLLDATARGRLTAVPGARSPELAAGLAGPAPLASPLVTVIDDPTVPGAYGGFAFDDEGEPAAPVTLLDRGRIAARLSDRAGGPAGRGRRPGHLGPIAPSPSHLRLVPGTTDPRQLHDDGFLLEGGVAAVVSPGGDRVRIVCTRARELKAGNPTGRLYGDVELVGSLSALLAGIDAVAATATTLAPRDPADRDPTWRSISVPAIRTRGLVRAPRTRP